MNLGLTKTNNLVVTDCDEVLCNISPKWYRRIRENFKLFEKDAAPETIAAGPKRVHF